MSTISRAKTGVQENADSPTTARVSLFDEAPGLVTLTVPNDCGCSLILKFLFDNTEERKSWWWWWVTACRLGDDTTGVTFQYRGETAYRVDILENAPAVTDDYLTEVLKSHFATDPNLPTDPPIVGGPSGTKPTLAATSNLQLHGEPRR